MELARKSASTSATSGIKFSTGSVRTATSRKSVAISSQTKLVPKRCTKSLSKLRTTGGALVV